MCQLIKVSLQKMARTFGFTVAGGMKTGGCFIKQIVADPALRDGRLRSGDRIVQVIYTLHTLNNVCLLSVLMSFLKN